MPAATALKTVRPKLVATTSCENIAELNQYNAVPVARIDAQTEKKMEEKAQENKSFPETTLRYAFRNLSFT